MGPWIRGQAAAKKTLNQAGPIECVLRHSSEAIIHSSYRDELATEQGNRRGSPQTPPDGWQRKVEKTAVPAASNARKTIGAGPGAFSSPRSPPLRIHWPLTTGHW